MPPALPEGPWDIYSKQLISIAYGYPLWDPEPEQGLADMEIGAVGWLHEGRFRQLFNAMKPEDDVVQKRRGVPAGFTPLERSELDIIGPDSYIRQPVLASRSIDWHQAGGEAEVDTVLAPFVSAGAKIEFTVADDAGAVLFLEPPAKKEFILSKRQIVAYMRQHFDSWMEHANVRGGYELKQEDVIFVSGTTKTTRWANAAFHGSYRQKEGSISCGVNGVGKFSMKLSIANRNLPNPLYNYGPSSLDSDIDTIASTTASDPVEPPRLATTQCIFFHYYKMKKRILWRPRPIRAAAGPDELPPDDDNAGGNEQALDLDFEEHPQSSPPYDPVEILLEWILEHSNAEIAVATDRDLIAMFPTTGIPLDVRAGLEEAPPSIDVDEEGVGTVVVDLHLIEGEHPSAHQVANPVAEEEAGSDNQVPAIGDFSTSPTDALQASQVEQPIANDRSDERLTEDEAVKRTPGAWIAATNVHSGAVVSLAVSPDSKWVASGSEGGTIILWDAGDQSDVRNWESHADSIGDLAFSPDSRRLLSAGGDGQIMVWDVEQGGILATLEGHTEAIHAAVWSPDGTKIASASEDMTVRVWNTETYEQIHLLEGHNAMVTFVLFSSDGTMLASGGADYNCRIWNVDEGTVRYELQGHKGMVWSAAFDPECRRIATASDDGSVRIWSTSTGDALVTLQEHHGPVWNVAFSGDGKEIMSASSDSTIKVCDSYSGERKLSLDGHDSMVNSACFSPDGKYIASASSDSTVRLWKTSDGTCVRTFNEHNDKVTHALFTPNGEILSSGADDGTVRIRVLSDWV